MRGSFALPVVAETNDGRLNDINGFHVELYGCGQPTKTQTATFGRLTATARARRVQFELRFTF